MVTSPQDHWMIKEKILKLEGERKDKTKFGPIREFFGEKWQFFSKSREVRQKVSMRGGRGGLTIERERRGRP